MNLKQTLEKTLEQAEYLHTQGIINTEVFDGYYYLWYFSTFRYGHHIPPAHTQQQIAENLSLSDLEVFIDRLQTFDIKLSL